METWQDIKDFFFDAVQDRETSQAFFTTTQAVAWANAALWEMAEVTKYYDVTQAQNTAAGTRIYQVGASGMPPLGIWRVEIDDEAIRPTTEKTISKDRAKWENRSGIPKFYYLDQANAVPDRLKLGLYEEPDGIYELRTYSYGVPAQVSDSADGDSLQVPQWAIHGVLWYMLSEAYMAETRRMNMDTSAFYRMLFEGILDRLEARTNNRLAKRWVAAEGGHQFDADFWSNLPDTIPEPA